MSDVKKSQLLRAFLWLIAISAVGFVVIVADLLADLLPIWQSKGQHNLVESITFWTVVAPAIWRWLSRRVWIGSKQSIG